MKLTRCPICHSELHLDALISDDAGRELLAIIAQLPSGTARGMVEYLALFRPEKSHLTNGRALKLVQEVLEKYKPGRVLADALFTTAQQIHTARVRGGAQVMNGHNYLAKVYESSTLKFAGCRPEEGGRAAPSAPAYDAQAEYEAQLKKFNIDPSTTVQAKIRGAKSR